MTVASVLICLRRIRMQWSFILLGNIYGLNIYLGSLDTFCRPLDQ